ncbi:hypothetical protein [Blastococcus sp. SYSU D00820]
MRALTLPAALGPLSRHLPGAARRPSDVVRTAGDLVAAGHLVAVEPGPDGAEDPVALAGRLSAAGLAGSCELTVAVDPAAPDAAARDAARVLEAGLGVVLAGPDEAVRRVLDAVPTAGVVVPVTEPGAEERCRALAGGRVRLAGRAGWPGRGTAAADLTFVRCLNVLMSAAGRPAVGTTDPRLVAIAGERAAWNDRDPDSWEYVMTWGVRTEEQRRLLAGGYRVRVALPAAGSAR